MKEWNEESVYCIVHITWNIKLFLPIFEDVKNTSSVLV